MITAPTVSVWSLSAPIPASLSVDPTFQPFSFAAVSETTTWPESSADSDPDSTSVLTFSSMPWAVAEIAYSVSSPTLTLMKPICATDVTSGSLLTSAATVGGKGAWPPLRTKSAVS